MSDKCSIVLDSSVIALPAQEISDDTIECYLKRLLNLNKLLYDPFLVIYLSNSIFVSPDGNSFPYPNKVIALFNKYQKRKVNYQDVAKIINSLMRSQKIFESEFGFDSLSISEITLDSDNVTRLHNKDFRSESEKLIVKSAILRSMDQLPYFEHFQFVNNVTKSEVKVQARLKFDEMSQNSKSGFKVDHSGIFSGVAKLVSKYSDLAHSIHIKNLDQQPRNCGIEFVVHFALLDFDLNNSETKTTKNAKLIIGDQFTADCARITKQQGRSFRGKLVRSIINVARGTDNRKSHAIRIEKGGGSKNLKIDGKVVQRIDVDRDIHIHFVPLNNNSIKLTDLIHHEKNKVTT